MKIIKLGSKGSDVKILQDKLNLLPDGIFGSLTQEAVKEFQKKKGLTVDGIVGNKTWNALMNPGSLLQHRRAIKEIIVHCSATPEGKDFTVADIKRWHLERGFSNIGYHYVIYRDGSINKGRDESISGAHCSGHNSNSIGVCYIGGCTKDNKTPKDTRTEAQKRGLILILKELKNKYPKAAIYGHNNFSSKACPCFNAKEEYKNI